MKKFILILLFVFACITQIQAYQIPNNLYKGLIAEDTSGNYKTYLTIASCVRNRLVSGMSHGLVALKRKDLDSFVHKECAYALKTKNIDLENQAKGAIREVFDLDKDYCNDAVYYEHTKRYKIPSFVKGKRVLMILHAGTKNEITFWSRK